jgi:hypothetical protein
MERVPPQNSLWVNGNRRYKWASRICQGAVSPSVGPLARVPCWNPLGLRPGDLHAPNSFVFSSRCHIRVWVLLRFNLSSNSVAIHRFVRPHLVIKSVWLHLLFLLVFLIVLAGISLHGEAIRVTRVVTNGAVVLWLRGSVRSEPCFINIKFSTSQVYRTSRKIGTYPPIRLEKASILTRTEWQ